MKTAIWWIRRDLRLSDNQALNAALAQAEQVVPVFILDTQLLSSPYASSRRIDFMLAGLRMLDGELRKRGSRLILRHGDALQTLQALSVETGAEKIFAEADVSPYAQERDDTIKLALPLTLTAGITVNPPETSQKPDGSPYTVFTAFSRKWQSLPLPGKPLPAPEVLHTPASIASLELPQIRWEPTSNFTPGESAAQSRLEGFAASSIYRYEKDRDRMDIEGTSGLSPYLRFGMLSARQAAWTAFESLDLSPKPVMRWGVQTWLNELVWREFYATILYYFPDVRRRAFRAPLRNIAWRNDPEGFAAWAEGCTGFPIVDASMRQLNATGWMHNRGRMITASFLTKDLLIDWQQGERYFMHNLLDGDPAANNGGWQWTAGTGTDAAPYFRIFNPVLQGRKFDPHGEYIRRWVPELSAVPVSHIHSPWEMPLDMQFRVGCRIGKDYPVPIVDHALARQRTLAAYRIK